MNELIKWLLISFAYMFLGPKVLAATTLSMALVFIMFYVLNPAYSVFIGYKSGKDIRHLWPVPILSPVFYLLGIILFFDKSEPWFYIFAVGYLLLGVIAMLVSAGKERNNHE